MGHNHCDYSKPLFLKCTGKFQKLSLLSSKMSSEGEPQNIILYCHIETDTPFTMRLFYLNSALTF